MSKVYLICGRICSGKTTYAKKFCSENNAILLSADEIMHALFDKCCGRELHTEYERRIKNYLFNKSLELIEKGFDIVLDWGFWSKEERNAAKKFYKSRNIDCELHYIEVSDETWKNQLNKRNTEILNKEAKGYYLEHDRALEFSSMFKKPDNHEIDVLV